MTDGDDDPESSALETDDQPPLAAIVSKDRSQAALGALREADLYDDTRRIREFDDGTIAIPVTAAPLPDRQVTLGIHEIVRQEDPEPRAGGLEALLRERGWTDAEIETAPGSWAVIGTVVIVEIPDDCADEAAVGEALLDLHREADTVLAREGIDGQTRDPTQRVVAGAGDTETIHAEHGVRYALDLAEVMFSPGNEAERARIAALVAAGRDAGAEGPVATLGEESGVDPVPDAVTGLDPADGEPLEAVGGPAEHVFDMFAGVGYFTLPAAVAGAEVTAAEIDPDTFQYLIENAQLNDVGDRVSAYLSDCREVAEFVDADRVLMGHWDAAEYLDAAFDAVRDDGVIHYHAVVAEPELPDDPREDLEAAAADAGRSIAIVDLRRIKSYGEGVWHVVVDARVSSP
ncbi:methyltransferase [Salinarchaeum sp. Harcht-Bsk1]|uniref:class I SAM-dependent methyltransferase n=1 Tax=Salinarchaeum sp. Harcht-Bsk1 TaxID=1333523 RepID=UPI000342471A|nr:class I SAM-dependent methyltransferase family protein [Salinarchaeum sp. Harcht-Bsk1]AGN01915.1 methyltransferase [Salinarchaeum sp. Harcht-Bsk1]